MLIKGVKDAVIRSGLSLMSTTRINPTLKLENPTNSASSKMEFTLISLKGLAINSLKSLKLSVELWINNHMYNLSLKVYQELIKESFLIL